MILQLNVLSIYCNNCHCLIPSITLLADDSVQGGKEKCDGVCQLEKQVEEVKGIMRDNIDKALDRGDKLEDLEDRSKQLEIGVRMIR